MTNKLRFLHVVILLFGFSYAEQVENLIIDTDAGADDAIAILLLLRAEALREFNSVPHEVIGITCSYGNTIEENVEINVLKTLTIANRSDIPVYGGAKKPLIGNHTSDKHFGEDGFGDAEFEQEIIGKVDRSMHASMALIELSKKYEGNISILIIGPTTNVAMAISLDGLFIKRVKKFYVMGSSVAGVGVIKPNVEFNFGADPESTFILLNSTTNSQLTLYPWETSFHAKITKDWRRNVFGKFDSPYIKFLNAVESIGLSNAKQKKYAPTDAVTAALIVWPEIVTSSLDTNVEAVYDGAARGSVLVNYRPEIFILPKNARIVQSIDEDKFKEILLYHLTCEVKC